MTHPYEGIPGGLCKRCGQESGHAWHDGFGRGGAAPDSFQLGDDSDDFQIVFHFSVLLDGISQIIHTKARSIELLAIEGDAFNPGRAATSIETPEKVEFYQVELPGPLRTISGEAAAAFWKWYQENR